MHEEAKLRAIRESVARYELIMTAHADEEAKSDYHREGASQGYYSIRAEATILGHAKAKEE